MNFRFCCYAAALLALPSFALAQNSLSSAPTGTKSKPATARISTLAGTCGEWTTVYHAKLPGQESRRALVTSPTGLVLDGKGSLYLADDSGINKVVLATGEAINLAGNGQEGYADGPPAAARFAAPGSLVLDGKGNLYVTDYRNHRVRQVELATGRVSTLAGTGTAGTANGPGTQAQLHYPSGLALDDRGNLYVSEIGSSSIRRIVLSTGAVSTVAGSGKAGFADGVGKAAQFSWPRALALDGQGNLYVADGGNHRIRKIVLATGAVSTVSGGAEGYADGLGRAARFHTPTGLALDGQGNLYVTESGNYCIRKIVLATGAVSTVIGNGKPGYEDGVGPAARLKEPKDLVVDGQGRLYVADHNCIRQVEL
jgi:sugar lactone lactonase YvrE